MDYTVLINTVLDYLERDDLLSQVGTFINLGQLKLERGFNWNCMLKTFDELTTAADPYVVLPTDFKAVNALFVSGGGLGSGEIWGLENAPLSYSVEWASGVANNTPRFYVVHNELSMLRLVPTPDTAYNITGNIFRYSAPLSVTNTTNWWSTQAYDCLIYAALVEAAPFLENDAKMAVWKSMLNESATQLQRAEMAQKTDERPIRLKAAYVV